MVARDDAASLTRELFDSLPEEERRKMAPDFTPKHDEGFPLANFPPVIRELALASSALHKSKPQLAALTALGVLSASLGKGLKLRTINSLHTTGNLYIIISMRTGGGKTTEAGPILGLLRDYQLQRRAAHGKLVHRSEAKLVNLRRRIATLDAASNAEEAQSEADLDRLAEMRAEEASLVASTKPPTILTEDATSERFVTLAEENNGVLASMATDARDAAENLLGRYSKAGANGGNPFIKGFSGDPIEQARVTRASVSMIPRFTTLWLLQPDCLDALFKKDAHAVSGLAPRFLICRIERALVLDTFEDGPPSADIHAPLRARLQELLTTYFEHPGEPYEISATREAATAIMDYGNRLKTFLAEENTDEMGGFIVRWAEQAWRIALVLHAAEHGSKAHQARLEERNARTAVALAEWFSRYQMEALQVVGSNKTAEKLRVAEECVRRHPNGVPAYKVRRDHQSVFTSAKDAQEALSQLVEEGRVKMVKGVRGLTYHPVEKRQK